jgi:nicotinate-nucleotide adenylyltransferase
LTKLDESLRRNVEIVAVRESDVSSTEIRERIRRGLSIADFVPPKVEQYIRENGLYQV